MLPLNSAFGNIPSNEAIQSINARITQLREQLHEVKMQQMRNEVQGQDYMIADWTAYEQELKDIRADQEVIKKIQNEIDHLEKRKIELSQTKTQAE